MMHMKEIDEQLVNALGEEPLSPEERTEQGEREEYNRLNRLLVGMKRGEPIFNTMEATPWLDYALIREKINKQILRRRRRIRYSSMVAAIVLLIGVSAVFNYWQEEQPPTPPLSGRTYAELKMDDGIIVKLHPDIHEKVILSNTTSEVKTKENTLVYTVLDKEEKLKYNTLTVPPGAEYNLLLADGTKVYLNSGSELRYPMAFPGEERKVFLKGEAFFEVTPDSTKLFLVETECLTATVLGTSFNIRSYDHQRTTAATLVGGLLKVTMPDKEYILQPGTQALFDKERAASSTREVNVVMYTSWKNGYYFFDNMTLEEIMETISPWYNLKVEYQDMEVKTIPFFGHVKRYDNIVDLLKKFESTNEIEFSIHGNKIAVRKK